MLVHLIGLNHKTAPVELRERLHIEEGKLPEVLQKMRATLPEVMIFSTCNRFEVLARVEQLEQSREILSSLITQVSGLPGSEFEPMLYSYAGPDAVKHVFRVASSLDSLVVGEPQILGQMKQFFSIAQKEKTISFTLNSIMERAFMIAKKIRTETLIANTNVSVSSVAVELAAKIFDRLEGKTAFVIGAGKMSILALQHLQAHGVKLILVTNRSFHKAAEIAEQVKGRAVPFEDLAACLSESDIVISSTGSPTFIVNKEHVQKAMSVRRNKPIFFIDIAVPRDIDPQINAMDNIFLYDIDDLHSVAEKNRQKRAKEAEKAEEIIQYEADQFWNKLKSADIAPTIREIQQQIDALRMREMERTLKKMGPLSEEQKQALEQLTASLTNKIVGNSYAELRQLSNQPDGLEKIELIRKLFRL